MVANKLRAFLVTADRLLVELELRKERAFDGHTRAVLVAAFALMALLDGASRDRVLED